MKFPRKPYLLPVSLLVLSVATTSPAIAQLTFKTNSAQAITGEDKDLNIRFAAVQTKPDWVQVNVYLGQDKQVKAELDYARKTVTLSSFSTLTQQLIPLRAPDILTVRKLLRSLAPNMTSTSPVGDALTSLLNVLSSAPNGVVLNLNVPKPDAIAQQQFTSACSIVGADTTATYTLNDIVFTPIVTVGPQCFADPAFGRCGADAGPDPVVGLLQRFTQECLNHDQCCAATQSRPVGAANVCGNSGTQCIPEFFAAAPGFFFAPDCGTTAGQWLDNLGNTYALRGGASIGVPIPFAGTVNTPSCGVWPVRGIRAGTSITFTGTNPQGQGVPAPTCAAAFTYTGVTTDCNVGDGTWVDTSGNRGLWNWTRQGLPTSGTPK
jgi:hypothetical protein